MKIVILDGYTLNPGDLSWDELKKIGNLVIYDRTLPDQVIERAKGAEIILTNKAIVNRDSIQGLPELKYIGVMATGYNVVNIETAKQHKILVTNAPSYSTASTAQHTFALILELTNRVGLHAESVKDGEWLHSPDFCFRKSPLTELDGKTLGIIGFGRIGRQVAKIAQAFGLKIIAFHKHPERDKMEGVKFTTIEEVFSQSDLISLHCPLTAENNEFVNNGLLSLMKPSAFLINTGRGQLINEKDLATFLNNGKIAGAALDVVSSEPPSKDNPLLDAKNCIITPHIAWSTKEARERLIQIVAENIKAYLSGKPQNVVV
ncbi:MAG TPA: D-2-hydroxyacid dehydrogenase [Cytophagales bacterium]|nr:D-2-hydroxyacid dehydrogenase [Cytophagales bacterium]